MFTKAATTDLAIVENIMESIRSENPDYWPNGLTKDHFDTDGLYMVRKSASQDPVGFVGWQKRHELSGTTGYYSIGILPEYRQQGFAKSAVSNIINLKSNEVDNVKALIVEGNTASEDLANSLGVVIKSASAAKGVVDSAAKTGILRNLLKHLAWGVGSATPTTFGRKLYEGDRILSADDWDSNDAKELAMNSILGSALSAASSKVLSKELHMAGMTTAGFTGLPYKTFALSNMKAADRATEQQRVANDIARMRLDMETNRDRDTGMSIDSKLGLGLGIGALGLGGYGLYKYFKGKEEERDEARKPKLRLTLPTEREGDVETQIELPAEDITLSKKIFQEVGRDARRKLRAEGKERTHRRNTKEVIDV